MELIGVYRVLPKMKMTIPKEIAEKWDLKPKDKLVVYYDEKNGRMVVEKWEKK
jgi:AbrB family looped-hinge helix DNA binding protein